MNLSCRKWKRTYCIFFYCF